jgi:FMN phosphatase YigB (HAD superfamily)
MDLSGRIVMLFDVDNTLLDNDRVVEDLMRHLECEIGHERQQHYWRLFEQLRDELGYADYLGALQRYRLDFPRDFHILAVSHYLVDYPFATRLFPNSLDVVDRFKEAATTVILTDGDVVFQPLKIHRSGLYKSLGGKVLVYVHKERELEDVAARYPAGHYVLVDDKPRILNAVKQAWGAKVTTVFPLQGHYAHDLEARAQYPPADVTVERIGALLDYDLPALLAAAKPIR